MKELRHIPVAGWKQTWRRHFNQLFPLPKRG